MSYIPRDHESLPWVADNGLRVDRRTSQSMFLSWSLNMSSPSTDPSPSTSVEDTTLDRVKDGVDGPWYEVQMKKASSGEKWDTVYRGYRTRCEVKELVPDAIIHFRMKKNGDEKWGSTIIAATDTCPPVAEDIHRAVTCNAEDMVLRIIGSSKGVRLRKLLQTHDCAGMTPLMIACQTGNINIASILIKSGAWPNAPSFTNERTALMYACMNGNVRLLELMDKYEADWTMKDKTGCNAFHHAINANKLVSLKYAVARCGIGLVNEPDMLGWTPLLRSRTCIEVVTFLLSKGADPCVDDKNHSKSCLIAAVMLGKKEVCDILLEHGADPTYKNSNGQTAYDIASSLRNREIADTIVKTLTMLASDRNSNVKGASFSSRASVVGIDRQGPGTHQRGSASSYRTDTDATSSRVIFGNASRGLPKKNE